MLPFLRPLAGRLGLQSISRAAQQTASDVRTVEVFAHGYQLHVRVYTNQDGFGHGENPDAAERTIPLIRCFSRVLLNQVALTIEAALERIPAFGMFAGAQGGSRWRQSPL
jgi:hypothetical protein